MNSELYQAISILRKIQNQDPRGYEDMEIFLQKPGLMERFIEERGERLFKMLKEEMVGETTGPEALEKIKKEAVNTLLKEEENY